MIQHFNFKPLFENTALPGWALSFYYKQQYFQAEYRKDGEIIWLGVAPHNQEIKAVETMIHELMLFHVYD